MARIALISAGVVKNIVEADMAFAVGLGFDAAVESDTAGIGWQYNGSEFIAPTATDPQPEPPATPDGTGPFLSNYAFDMRFTLAEHRAIKRLAEQRDANGQYTDLALDVQTSLARAAKAKYTNPKREATRQGVLLFVQAGVYSMERALEILDAPIQPFEAYTG